MTLEPRFIVNIKVIAKINVGEKLSYTNGYFSIACDKTITAKLKRWMIGDSRLTTIDAIDSLITICLTHTSYSHAEQNHVIKELQSALIGLSNLMVTYQDDLTVVSRLEFIHDRIQDYIRTNTNRTFDFTRPIEEIHDTEVVNPDLD